MGSISRHHQEDLLVLMVWIEEMKKRGIEVTLQLLASAVTRAVGHGIPLWKHAEELA